MSYDETTLVKEGEVSDVKTMLAGTSLALALWATPVAEAQGKPVVVLGTSLGEIRIELEPEKAPITVKNFLDYVKAGYYEGTIFHRVIPGFMIQGGGLTADMQDKREGKRAPIKNESGNGLRNDMGSVAMARTPAPDSATSQFFINVKDNVFLNRDRAPDGVGYAVFGKVIQGMEVVRKIEQARTGSKGIHQNVPLEPVVIKSARVVSE